jgi:HD-like signal output (HDOD) protein
MPLPEQQIKKAIESCPRLGSLRKINSTFKDLARADQDFSGQIAEIIRRDPALTSRLLQMVNSAYYGLDQTVSSVEDAVFYLGTKQIRQMALATPVLEDLQQFVGGTTHVDWMGFWLQSIGCAVMTRELLSYAPVAPPGDADYISGLVSGMGYLVSNHAFPAQMAAIYLEKPESESHFSEMQKELIGWDHLEVAAHYMESHHIPEAIRVPVRYQNHPEEAGDYRMAACALYVAKRMISSPLRPQFPGSSTASAPRYRIPMPNAPEWDLCPELHQIIASDGSDPGTKIQSLRYTLQQLPEMMRGLI